MSGSRERHHRRDVLGLEQHEVAPDQIDRETDPLDLDDARVLGAGQQDEPGFSAPNVTVRSARTAGPSTTPVAPFTPEGMSTATSGTGEAA